jgi:hypothetical protein
MLSIIFAEFLYAEYHFAEFLSANYHQTEFLYSDYNYNELVYAEYNFAELLYAEYHFAEFLYAEYRYAKFLDAKNVILNDVMLSFETLCVDKCRGIFLKNVPNVIKLFTSKIYEFLLKARVFILGRSF